MKTCHDGYKDRKLVMLINLSVDPHELHDLSEEQFEYEDQSLRMLSDQQHAMILRGSSGIDPRMTVLHEGGPCHTRGRMGVTLEHLRATGRGITPKLWPLAIPEKYHRLH